MQLVASWLPTVDSLSVIVGNCVVVVASLVVRIKKLGPLAKRIADRMGAANIPFLLWA